MTTESRLELAQQRQAQGNSLRIRGEFAAAKSLLEQALSDAYYMGNKRLGGIIRRDLGRVYHDRARTFKELQPRQAQLTKAIVYYERSHLELLFCDSVEAATTRALWGMAMCELGQNRRVGIRKLHSARASLRSEAEPIRETETVILLMCVSLFWRWRLLRTAFRLTRKGSKARAGRKDVWAALLHHNRGVMKMKLLQQ